jgi:uroporphyrin-III C-methyltransferase
LKGNLEEKAMIDTETQIGRVHLIGAGPGDPKLLTIRAAEAIASSDAVVYDYLVNPEILKHARPKAAVIFVGKRAGQHTLSQELINDLLIERAGLGETVARLKGGDPLVFGRGSEEAEALTEAGIPWDFIPGVSSGIAAAAYAGIPLTHRGYSSSVAFITGHESSGKGHNVDWPAAARGADTLVVFMCAATISNVARKLIAGGRAPSTPIALIRWGTYEHQEVYRGTLEDIALLDARVALVRAPVIAVIGKVVSLSDALHWFGSPAKSIREVIQRGELSHDSEEDAYVTVRRRA